MNQMSFFRRSVALPALGTLGMGFALLASMSSAHADTLPNLSEACFTYQPGHVTTSGHKITATGFQAALTGTPLTVQVNRLTFGDQSNKLDTTALTQLNAAAAYTVLLAYNQGQPPACQAQPLPEIETLKASLPELDWTGVTLKKSGHNLTVQKASLRMLSTTPQAHLRFSATGLHEADHPMVPQTISGELSFTPAPTPPYHITFQNVQAALNKSTFNAQGTLTAGAALDQSNGDMHVTITDIGPLIDQVSQVVPAKVTAALLIARLMGHSDGAHTTSWDVTLTNGQVKINGIKIPLSAVH